MHTQQVVKGRKSGPPNVAVITPYHGERSSVLHRCHESVLAQNHSCDHFLVADGAPQEELDGWHAHHLRLPAASGDHGNTPRSIGAVSAFNLGYDAVAFLDADNWFRPDHVQNALSVHEEGGAPVIISDRQLVLASGELCPWEDADMVARETADTSCFMFMSDVAYLSPIWAAMGRALSPICDRVMFEAVRQLGIPIAWTNKRSLFYESRWGNHYRAMGLEAPEDEHTTDWAEIGRRLDPAVLHERLGFKLNLTGLVESGWSGGLVPVNVEEVDASTQ